MNQITPRARAQTEVLITLIVIYRLIAEVVLSAAANHGV